MKKVFSLFVLMIIAAGFAGQLQAQKDFNGIVTYKVNIDSETMDPQMAAMLPKFIKVYYRDDKSRTEMNMPMFSVVTIKDGTEKTLTHLIDAQGNKSAKVQDYAEIKEQFPKDMQVDVREVDETKEIAGIECKKAVITIKEGDKKERMNVYYAPDLGNTNLNFDNIIFQKVPGMLMQFEMNDAGVNMELVASEVQKKRVSKKMFEIPKEYEIAPQAEVKRNPEHVETELD